MRFNYRTKPGTATAGADFVAKSGRKRIKAGRRATKVKVRVKGDELIEGTERFTLRIANAKGAKLKRRNAIGSIADREPEPAPDLASFELFTNRVEIGLHEVGEVTLTGPAPSDTEVEIESSDETTANVQGGVVVVPAGAASASVEVAASPFYGSLTLTASLGLTELAATLSVAEYCP